MSKVHRLSRDAEVPIAGPAARREYAPDDVIADKYQLVRRIATGGMGTVWVANNLALDVKVALKLIRSDVAAPVASGRLLQEARAAAQLDHPGIVRIFDFGRSSQDDPFIVMELLDGESLAELLERRSRLPVFRSLQLMLPIADALSVAHHKGVIHRDLKPENILLHRTERGTTQPKIVDFGIARVGAEQNKRLTQDGMVMGSPAYMSPEQARGREDVDHRADIWAFAVVLYEALAGKLPFDAANNFALLREVVERDPVPITDFAVGDPELWAILERALRKERDERWQSMRAFGMALATWLTGQGVQDDVCGASLTANWLTPAESQTGRLSSPPPLVGSGVYAAPEGRRRLAPDSETIDATSVVKRLEHSPGGRLARLSLVFGVTVLALAGFLLTRQLMTPLTAVMRPASTFATDATSRLRFRNRAQSQAPVVADPALEAERSSDTPTLAERGLLRASPGKPSAPRSVRGAAVGGPTRAAPRKPRASASELKLPY